MAYNGFPSRPCACWINCNVLYPIFPIISSSLDARKTSSTIMFFLKKTVVRDYYSFFPSHSRCTLSIPPIKGLVGMETHTQKKYEWQLTAHTEIDPEMLPSAWGEVPAVWKDDLMMLEVSDNITDLRISVQRIFSPLIKHHRTRFTSLGYFA